MRDKIRHHPVNASSRLNIAIAASRSMPHMSGLGRKEAQTAGRSG